MRNVLVTGGNFVNQGAYLMLVAAGQGIREHLGAQPVIPVRFGTERQKSWIGYETLLAEERFGLFPRLGRNRRAGWRDRLPFVTASDIDAVFDVTGFAFGDQWVDAPLMRRAKNYAWWASRDVPVYMLPQAFGPFVHTFRPAALAVRSSRLVHARDQDSYNYLASIVSPDHIANVRLSPDFTLAVKGVEPFGLEKFDNFGVIVPNWNILKRGTPEQGTDYIACLGNFASVMEAHGLHVVGVCHEGRGDREILERLQANFPSMSIVDNLDGQELKWLLGRSTLVVSGRYHALVSALAQGVPSVLHGWSHKYQWLARDFDCADMVGDPFDDSSAVGKLIDQAVGDDGLRQRILAAGKDLKNRNLDMWREIRVDLNW